jgi:hypothetical protein
MQKGQAMSTRIEPSDVLTAGTATPAAGVRPPQLFSATVQGMDEDGQWFECNVPLDGHLDGDLYLKLDRAVELHAALFIVMRLAGNPGWDAPAMRVAVHGRVDRVRPALGGYDLRVVALDYRVL